MSDALFPPTSEERLAAIAVFIKEEIKHREHMAWRHPERSDYWLGRVEQARQALAHVEELKEVIA